MFGFCFTLTILLVFVNCDSSVYFEDRFLSDSLDDWTQSAHEPDTLGKFILAKPKINNVGIEDVGLKTSQDAKFYRISRPLVEPLKNKDKSMCVQFSVKHEQDIDCGGGYVKLLGEGFDAKAFHGETPYEIMFGPDICGFGTKKVHLIFSYKGKNHLIKKDVPCKSDILSHLYTLILKPDNSYEILIDKESVGKGFLSDDWDMLPPKTINDPEVSKPSDWVDDEMMNDPEDKKPEDWDQPETITDPDAKKPDDWDEDMDGEWTAPTITNPDHKGVWSPKRIKNPDYKGEWVHPQIANPDYKEDPELYSRTITALGIDIWQVKSGTIFDNFIISTDLNECETHAQYWKERFDFELEQQKIAEEESKKADEEAKAKKETESEVESDTEEPQILDFPKKTEEDENETEEEEKSETKREEL